MLSEMNMRRKTRQVSVGDVKIGGGAKISIQSMLNAKTTDVEGCIAQINRLRAAGCDLIRLAVPDEASAEAFGVIAKRTGLPLIADIHYSYKLAHMALDAGAKKIRMNPGNMRAEYSLIEPLAKRMSDLGVPIRVGVNGGSLDKRFAGLKEEVALKESALECANLFERAGLKDIVVAIKASDPLVNVEANRLLAHECDFPLHIGVTEAGTLRSGLIKSSISLGALLAEGIGDTVRVSLSCDVVEEVLAAKKILMALKLRDGVDVVSCPTCARTQIDVEGLAQKIELMCASIDEPLKISVLGCPLNGIGEGKKSDIGVAGGKEKSVLLEDGKIVGEIKNDELMPALEKLIKEKLKSKKLGKIGM